jgi:hypothetical protein
MVSTMIEMVLSISLTQDAQAPRTTTKETAPLSVRTARMMIVTDLSILKILDAHALQITMKVMAPRNVKTAKMTIKMVSSI